MVKEFVEKYLANPHFLMNLTMEITSGCNLKCCHCYVEDRVHQEKSVFLPFDLIKRVVDEAYEMKAISISLTGGEPMTHLNFIEIIQYIKNKGFVLVLKTNGTLISEKNIRYIKECVDTLILTRYGFSSATYENVTGITGAFSKYENALKILEQNAITYRENIVLLKENEEELDLFLAANSLVETYISINRFNPYAQLHRPTDEALKKYYAKKIGSLEIGKYEIAADDHIVCNCGVCSLTINSQGDVNPCTCFYYSLGSLYDSTLNDIWECEKRRKLTEKCKLKFFSQCMECPNRKYIHSIAPCINYTETGNMNCVSEEMCRHCRIIKELQNGG